LGSCVEDGRKEELILIFCEVLDEYVFIRGQRARSNENGALASLPGHLLGGQLV
jgi:hypothetical protein